MAHSDHEHTEEIVRCTLYLEDEHIEHLDELAKEYSKALGQRWTRSAVVRLAVGDFLTKIGRIT
jgi:hypothetical protein